MLKINVQTINSREQRLDGSVGDYWIDEDGVWQIRISNLQNWRMEVAVAMHEIEEFALAQHNGIPEPVIQNYDEQFEKVRKEFPNIIGNQEPGDMIVAPYYKFHQAATITEKKVIDELGVSWSDYERTCESI